MYQTLEVSNPLTTLPLKITALNPYNYNLPKLPLQVGEVNSHMDFPKIITFCGLIPPDPLIGTGTSGAWNRRLHPGMATGSCS